MITAAAVLGAQKIFFSGSRSQPQEAVPQKNADEESAALQSAPSQQSAQSAGSQFLQSQTLVASPAVTYTADEQQNISVYQQFNEAVVNITTQVMGMNWFFEPIAEDGGSGESQHMPKGHMLTLGKQ